MRKKINIEIYNKRIHYNLEFKRSITLILGDSGTGKTTLVNMLESYIENNKLSGIHFKSNIDIDDIRVLKSRDENSIYSSKDSNKLYFADEFVSFVRSKRFMKFLKETGSYLVYFSRSDRTGFMQYSVDEIYELKSERHNDYCLTKMYNFYVDNNDTVKPDIIITEDKESGFSIISHIFNNVDTADGKDNVVNKIKYYKERGYKNIYIVVDGAAFGNQIQAVFSYSSDCNISVFAKESFEYLILGYSYFSKFLSTELSETYNFAESSIYFTWETYYTDLLKLLCKNYYNCKYYKVSWEKLNGIFKSEKFLHYIRSQFSDIDSSLEIL